MILYSTMVGSDDFHVEVYSVFLTLHNYIQF